MSKDSGRVVFNATRIHVPSDVLTTFKTAEVTEHTEGFIDAAKLYESMKELRAMQTDASARALTDAQDIRIPSVSQVREI